MNQNYWLAECGDSRGSFQRAALFILEFYSQKHEMSHPNLVISVWYLELTNFIVWQINQKHFQHFMLSLKKKQNSADIWQTKGQELTVLEDLSTS